jgi:hypothetical protein
MEDKLTIKISNFKLNIFRNLLEQSLIVDNQLMLEFSPEMIKSCSFSNTKSFMKLWTIPLSNLIINEEKDQDSIELVIIPKKKEILSFPLFNFYILKGDLFRKYLSVHNTDTVDLEFVLNKVNDKYHAANITISGRSENNSPLVTNFTLTTEELISNKIDDYSAIITECTPTKDMFEFVLTDIQIQEVKRLIKKLHKSSSNNTAFLTFNIDTENKKITVNDKVFTIEFLISEENIITNKSKNNFKFSILKSDFIITGNHSFTIYTNELEPKVILGANFANSVIWCLLAKLEENSMNFDESIMDSNMDQNIDSLNLAEYEMLGD